MPNPIAPVFSLPYFAAALLFGLIGCSEQSIPFKPKDRFLSLGALKSDERPFFEQLHSLLPTTVEVQSGFGEAKERFLRWKSELEEKNSPKPVPVAKTPPRKR